MVIGGLIRNEVQDTVTKVPFLGDVPVLGWAFKSIDVTTTKQNLLVFLTPHIIRSRNDLEHATIDRREQFAAAAGNDVSLHGDELTLAEESGIELAKLRAQNPVQGIIIDHRERYPVERMEALGASRTSRIENAPSYAVRAGLYVSEDAATTALGEILDAGYDAALITTDNRGELIYEIQVGPYDAIDDARTADAMLRGNLGLDPSITIIEADTP